MTSRERFKAITRFQQPDRVPLWDLEGITAETIRRWCCQGFPTGRNIDEYIGFDGNIFVPINTDPIPAFVQRTVHSDQEWTTYMDEFGFTVRRLKAQAVSPSIYYYVKGSVDSRDDWEALKKRYAPADIRRLPLSWGKDLIEYYNTCGSPVALSMHFGPGRGPKNGYTLGFETFLETLYSDPTLIHAMFDFWADFSINLWRPVVRQLKIDYVVFMEDGLAYKNSTLVGPQTYREFWMPYVRRVIDALRRCGVSIFAFYTSGNMEPLIPILLETGFNLFGPLEVAADMDAIQLRKEYGADVLLYGNIGRQALMDGPEAIDHEVMSKVPWLMERGGYIPAVDDMILPDISFASFMHYIDLMRKLDCV